MLPWQRNFRQNRL